MPLWGEDEEFQREDNDNHTEGGSALTKFREEEESIGGTREEGERGRVGASILLWGEKELQCHCPRRRQYHRGYGTGQRKLVRPSSFLASRGGGGQQGRIRGGVVGNNGNVVLR